MIIDSGEARKDFLLSKSPQIFQKPLKNPISEHVKIISQSISPQKLRLASLLIIDN
jgi:hypothetical protein